MVYFTACIAGDGGSAETVEWVMGGEVGNVPSLLN